MKMVIFNLQEHGYLKRKNTLLVTSLNLQIPIKSFQKKSQTSYQQQEVWNMEKQ
nr:hypothetical protein [Amedibacillus dolichus]